MAVPEEIRAVERPKGTAVFDNGGNGRLRWAVRELASVRYVEGKKNPQPRWGRTIGHIIDGVYVPNPGMERRPDEDGNLACVEYGFSKLAIGTVEDIKKDLLQIFPIRSAFAILVIAIIRAAHQGASDDMLSGCYEKSLLSLEYPGVTLSDKAVYNLFDEIGASMERRAAFTRLRLNRVASTNPVAIAGMVRENSSTACGLGAYTGVPIVPTGMEVSILYAYDVESGEPVCEEVFPGDSPDSSVYRAFLLHNRMTEGVLVDEKGSLPEELAGYLQDNPDIHYLTPVQRDDARIASSNLLEWKGVLRGSGGVVYHSKVQTEDDRYLYAFRDPHRAAEEEAQFGRQSVRDGFFDTDRYVQQRPLLGVEIFESDLDLPPRTVYAVRYDRWELDEVLGSYPSVFELVGAGDDYHAGVGSDFVNFISALITLRILRKIRGAGLFRSFTYGDIRDHLNLSWRLVNAPPPVSFDPYWVHTDAEDFSILEKLGLSTPDPDRPVERGRKRAGKTDSANTQKAKTPAPDPAAESAGDTQKVEKRKTGRPRIPPSKDPDAPKGKPGRPRIHPLKDPDAPKKKPGRPRIHPPKDPNAPRRKRGRPRKIQPDDLPEA